MKLRHAPLLVAILHFAVPVLVRSQDVDVHGVVKTIQYLQTPTGNPAVLSSNAYLFNAFAIATTNGALRGASVRLPNGTTRTLLPQPGSSAFRFEEAFNTQSALDGTYPSGFTSSYTLNFDTANDGARSASVSYFLASNPSTPTLNNLAAGQQIDHTAHFNLTWNSLGGSTLDLVQLVILDGGSNVVFATPAPFSPGAMDGTYTNAVIPAHTLPANQNFTGHLTVGRTGLPSTSYGTGVAALSRDTQFGLRTRPAPLAPRLAVIGISSNTVRLEMTGETNRIYRLQGTTNLLVWSDRAVTNLTTTKPVVIEDAANAPHRLYRVQVGQ